MTCCEANQVKEESQEEQVRSKRDPPSPAQAREGGNEVEKGVRRMPRLPQAKKDVISCEKPRRGADDL